MESKTKHRILGVVVVAGLAVLAYPFIQGGGNRSGEQAMVKAPAFPDQAIQVAASDDGMQNTPQPQDISNPTEDAQSTVQPLVESDASSSQSLPNPSAPDASNNVVNVAAPASGSSSSIAPGGGSTIAPAGGSTIAPRSGSTIAPGSSPSVEPAGNSTVAPTNNGSVEPAGNSSVAPDNSNATPATPDTTPPDSNTQPDQSSPQMNKPSAENQVIQPADISAAVNEPAVAPVKQSVKAVKHKKLVRLKELKKQPIILSKLTKRAAIAANKTKPVDNNGLLQLKQAAWVIQLGSFKQKPNALKLVNKLRAKGYRAFIQHVNGASGQNTRVFVGPEKQQASARMVAAELENEMKLHGIVISYKPFTL